MGYALRMSGEIHDWLADLRRSDPPSALLVGRALAALMSEGASLGPPLVVDAGAAALAARNRAHTLAEQRTRFGLTQTELADRMGIPRDQVAAIERADPGTTDVRTLAAYVEALGGRLEIIAEFAGDRVVLR